ncbi:unnamed protein product [Litomosoides sigmodontis]|uniref:Uncharacterized protein n=1 Tax=Litomosoides sigmodontis TaxID=42156 RepID=A0A3P6SXT7_LITSI|nr:unnamed protein product [Litomosoides sigmodontis]
MLVSLLFQGLRQLNVCDGLSQRPHTSPVPLLNSPPIAPSTTETSANSTAVSTLAEQFEMNFNKQSVNNVNSLPISGNKWTPKGGPKPKDLPQLLPTVEFKTTSSGGKYKKIDYEVIDGNNRVSRSETRGSSSSQHNIESKREGNCMDSSSSDAQFTSPVQQEQITIYEYDSQEISRRAGEKPNVLSLHEQKCEKDVLAFPQDSMPHRREWTEEMKTEVWSSTSKGVWQYNTRNFPPATVTPPASTAIRRLWSDTELRSSDVTSYEEKPKMDITSAAPSSTILVKQDPEERMATSTDTKNRGASYSVASTLEKTRELDEEITVRMFFSSAK